MLNLSIRTKTLLRAVKLLSQSPSDLHSLPNTIGAVEFFSSSVKLIADAEKKELVLMLNNLVYFGIVARIQHDEDNALEVKESGEVIVGTKNLLNVLSGEDAATVKLKENKEYLSIRTKHGTLHLNRMYLRSESYEDLKKDQQNCLTNSFAFELDHEQMRKIVSQVAYACAKKNQYRPILEAVNFYIEPKEKGFLLRCAATDSYRMAIREETIREEAIKSENHTEKSSCSKNVPAKTLVPLGKMLAMAENKKASTEIHCAEEKMMFSFDAEEDCHVDIISKLIDGSYPNVKNVIPPKFTTKVTVAKEDLYHALDRTLMMKKDGVSICKLSISKDRFLVTSFVPEIGSTEEKIKKYNIKGESVLSSFNTKFLIDILKSIEGDKISLYLNGSRAPMQITDDQDNCVLDLVVPVLEL